MERDIKLENSFHSGIDPSTVSRERVAATRTHNLSNRALLTLLLGLVPGANKDAEPTELTRQLLKSASSLCVLSRNDGPEFATVPGMSAGQALLLEAAFELGRRVVREQIVRIIVNTPTIVCQLLAHEYQGLNRESLRVLLLDTKLQLLRIEEVAQGSLGSISVHPRDIFRAAVVHSAHAIILTHNHPSGDPQPSAADDRLTTRLVQAGETMGIEVSDHIIIGAVRRGKPSYYSFKEEDRLG